MSGHLDRRRSKYRSHGPRGILTGNLGLRRVLSVTASLAMIVAGITLLPIASTGAQAVPAAGDDAVINVSVVQDVGGTGLKLASNIDPPLIGVKVTVTDADGHTTTATTDNSGDVTIDPSTSGLSGGQYRVDVTNPKPGVYYPGFAANGATGTASAPVTQSDLQDPDNAKLSTDTEFVDLTGGKSVYVNTSFWYPPYYCQNNAAVCDAVQPWDAPPGATSSDTEKTLFSAPYELNKDGEGFATKADTGAVYGIAYDRAHKRIFSAAYAKRGSQYGAGGPGGIYVTDLTSTSYPLSGTTTLFTKVPDAAPAADLVSPYGHDMDTNQDYGFFDSVGKESLGDIDVTENGKYLFGVNMYTKSVFVYDIENGGAAGTPSTYTIPNPCAVASDWRPMGTGTGVNGDYVGGICSGQSEQKISALTAHVYTFDPSTGEFHEVLNQSLDYGRGLGYTGAVYCTGAVNNGTTTADTNQVGSWFPWVDHFPMDGGLENPFGCDGQDGTSTAQFYMSYPEPVLDDIVEETNGDLTLGFRDRFSDQTGQYTSAPNADGVFGPYANAVADGDILRGCKLSDGDYVLDPNYDPASMTLAAGSTCTNNNVAGASTNGEPTSFREYYTGDWRVGGSHQETFFGGLALSRVEPNLISSGFDSNNSIFSQGVSAVNRDGTYPTTSAGIVVNGDTSNRFGKGSGLGDLEVLCDQAPVQIGNRVWKDSNDDGVQDAGEPPIAGVTVHLYDSDGNVVGTTTTNADGTYLFDDSNVDGGLKTGEKYTVKLDNPDDYTSGGPLDGMIPTVANAGSDNEHDSDGVVPKGGTYPEISLTTGGAGQDNPSYDFGFVEHKPAVTIQKYDTTAGATDGDADTASDAIAYKPSESRTIDFVETNSGTDALQNVSVTDDTITGGSVTGMKCTFPGHASATTGTESDGTWTVTWAQTTGTSPSETWAVGDTFTCTATLTMNGTASPHTDDATVAGTSVDTGETVNDSDAYNAYTGDVQLVKYDGRDGFTPTQDKNGIPQKPLVDGAARDANTATDAVTYVENPNSHSTGAQPVKWAVTNTGTTWLGDIDISDDTISGPDLTGVTCDFSGVGGPSTGTSWDGPWAPGSTFYCEGQLTLTGTGADSTHADEAKVTSTVIAPKPNPDYKPGTPGSNPYTDQPATDADGNPVLSDVHPTDDDDYNAKTTVPTVALVKGDGDASGDTISHDANTMDDGAAYQPGETRDIVMNLTNTGATALYDVTVTDALTAGKDTVKGLTCLFPGESTPTSGTLDGSTWTVYWNASFEGANPTAWQPKAAFSCTATLTLAGGAQPHADTATVTTNLSPKGTPGDSTNPPPSTPDGPSAHDAYNAYTGDIQVIKYDGNKADPAVGSGPASWAPPTKPLKSADQDANTWKTEVDYPAGKAQPVTWVVTNTGSTWLTDVTLKDDTTTGPKVGAWTCDLSPVGGPASYSFGTSGAWSGPLAPNASFFCTGPLTLKSNARHADTVDVTGTVVQPKFGSDDKPVLDGDGVPEYTTDGDGNPAASDVTVGDDDDFHAATTSVSIVKGDGHGDTIVDDADTTGTGAVYSPSGESRTIVSVATNPSKTPLHDVALTDKTTAGTAPTALSCTFPDGSNAKGSYDSATKTWTTKWSATFAPGNTEWQPGDEIVCHSTLKLDGHSAPHRDVASVSAVTPGGTDLTDSNPYNAFSGDIQVIKYDGNEADPVVGSAGSWVTPVKPMADAGQDANDASHSVHYKLDDKGNSTGPQQVRWVVTNTGATYLTTVSIADVTDLGPALKTASVSCTFPDGTTSGIVDGTITWHNPDGVLFAPGASFFCHGELTMKPDTKHADHVKANAQIVPPAADENGNPTAKPDLGPDGQPVIAINPADGKPWTVTDSDAFHAVAPAAPVAGLAVTGQNVWWFVLLAALLAALGAAAVLIARARRRRHS